MRESIKAGMAKSLEKKQKRGRGEVVIWGLVFAKQAIKEAKSQLQAG